MFPSANFDREKVSKCLEDEGSVRSVADVEYKPNDFFFRFL